MRGAFAQYFVGDIAAIICLCLTSAYFEPSCLRVYIPDIYAARELFENFHMILYSKKCCNVCVSVWLGCLCLCVCVAGGGRGVFQIFMTLSCLHLWWDW